MDPPDVILCNTMMDPYDVILYKRMRDWHPAYVVLQGIHSCKRYCSANIEQCAKYAVCKKGGNHAHISIADIKKKQNNEDKHQIYKIVTLGSGTHTFVCLE